ncbi:MAG TPA: hypothetical protein VGD33_10905 [Chitinophagaceae bacterium]
MKKLNTFLFILLLAFNSSAQNLATTIRVQGMEMGNALIKNDFNTFIKYMHPSIIDFAGGREHMKAKMDSGYQAMKQFGVSFQRYWIGIPGPIIEHNNQLQAILPQGTTMKTPFGIVTAESSLLVISNDKGRSWWFIDTNVYKAEKLKNILPDLSPKLVVPPMKKPKIEPIKE